MYVYGKIITNTTIKFVLSYMALTTINHINHSCFFNTIIPAWTCMHEGATCTWKYSQCINALHVDATLVFYMICTCVKYMYIYIHLYVHVCEYNLTIIYVYKLLLRNLIKIEIPIHKIKKIPTIFDLFSFGGRGTFLT